MSLVPRCTVCDKRIDAYGRQGTRCHRCNQPCPVCNRDLSCCTHPLPKAGLADRGRASFSDKDRRMNDDSLPLRWMALAVLIVLLIVWAIV